MKIVHHHMPSMKGTNSAPDVPRNPSILFGLTRLTPKCEHQIPNIMDAKNPTTGEIIHPTTGISVRTNWILSIQTAKTIIEIPVALLIRRLSIYCVEILCELIAETVFVSAPGAACAPGIKAASSCISFDAARSCFAFLIARI
jgi:hypothetical protein